MYCYHYDSLIRGIRHKINSSVVYLHLHFPVIKLVRYSTSTIGKLKL